MPERLRVLLLEDSAADGEQVAYELARGGIDASVLRVETEDAFLAALREFAPDIVLSDHSLAAFDGLSAIRAVRTQRPTTPVIIVTGSLDEKNAVDCLRAGADDYIGKDHLARLVPAIHSALLSRTPLQRLTPRQREVLRLIAEGRTTRDIAERLTLGVKTVETHRAAVMQRLDIHDVAGLVRFAIRVGLVSPRA
jgi:DNA-binding NarL/FixJ family response regulator